VEDVWSTSGNSCNPHYGAWLQIVVTKMLAYPLGMLTNAIWHALYSQTQQYAYHQTRIHPEVELVQLYPDHFLLAQVWLHPILELHDPRCCIAKPCSESDALSRV